MTGMVCAVVVTHRRPDELAKSLDVLSTQSRMVDHLIVVDNDFDERVRRDIAYVRNRSLALDLSILLRTIPAVLLQRGAY